MWILLYWAAFLFCQLSKHSTIITLHLPAHEKLLPLGIHKISQASIMSQIITSHWQYRPVLASSLSFILYSIIKATPYYSYTERQPLGHLAQTNRTLSASLPQFSPNKVNSTQYCYTLRSFWLHIGCCHALEIYRHPRKCKAAERSVAVHYSQYTVHNSQSTQWCYQ